MRVTINSQGEQLTRQIQRANLMFTAYQHDLSARGRELALATSRAADRIALEQYDAPEVHRVVVEVLFHWPDPLGANLLDSQEASWFNWFTVNEPEKSLIDPIGEGCLEPCSFCERGNISGWAHDDPLYVVADRIRNSFEKVKSLDGTLLFQATFANNVIEWLDPFLNFDIGSLAASLARLDCKVVFSSIIKPFNPEDQRMLAVAQRFSQVSGPNYAVFLALSFHLGIGSPGYDIIRAICDVGGGKIPAEIIDRYAQRYGLNLKILGPAISKVLLYGSGLGIRQGGLGEELFEPDNCSAVFNWATRQSLLRALYYAGINIVDRRPLHTGGRGWDFSRRLDQAFYEGKYLEADPNFGQDLVQSPSPHTRVARKSDGTIIVVNPRQPEEILVQTSLDELWPIIDNKLRIL